MSTDTSTGISMQLTPLVYTYSTHLQTIPNPPETFLMRDLPETLQGGLFDRLRENDIIERVEKDTDAGVYRWRLNPTVADALDRFEKPAEPGTRVTPCCGYRGFSNLRNGGFECGLCKQEFDDFDVVEEVVDAE
ncbi:hypothetical protein [Halorussus sp. AFM4]|uniref:hypothetical protein n=1 Tax=Halorussus sp. AFM4 TaxID=3421651 RepID=UPI003EB98FC4